MGVVAAQDVARVESNAGAAPNRSHTVFLFGATNGMWPG